MHNIIQRLMVSFLLVGLFTTLSAQNVEFKLGSSNKTTYFVIKNASDNELFKVKGNGFVSIKNNFNLNGWYSYKIKGKTVLRIKKGGNLFVGVNAGKNTTPSGSYIGMSNTFMGDSSGYNNTTGRMNTFTGNQAGYLNTVANFNTFNGYKAGYSNTFGDNNVFTGRMAGYDNTTGDYNAFTGDLAGLHNTTGNYNTFTGNEAGRANTTGKWNIFTGSMAGNHNTIGNYNVFTGFQTGSGNITGEYNVYVGLRAGYIATGSGNVFLGSEAGYYETSSDKLFIDNSNTSSPLIWGDFSTDSVRLNGDLHVTGDFYVDGSMPSSGGSDSDWTISSPDMYSAVSGNVGIGTTTPLSLLSVGGDGVSTAAISGESSESGGRGVQGWASNSGEGITNYGGYFEADGGDGRGVTGIASNNGEVFNIGGSFSAEGKFGYGVQAIVSGSSAQAVAGIAANTSGTGYGGSFASYGDLGTAVSAWASHASGVTYGIRSETVSPNGWAGYFEGRGYFSGKVGIGTDAPVDELDVVGHINTDSAYKITGKTVLKSTSVGNLFIGKYAGLNTAPSGSDIGQFNTFVGDSAGFSNTTGYKNTFSGYETGFGNISGLGNTFLGMHAGYSNSTANFNVSLGFAAGYLHQTGNGNVFIGLEAGRNNITGSGNVFVGKYAGHSETGSDKLYIENTNSASPLIWGDFDNNQVVINGNSSHNTYSRTFFSNGAAGGTGAWINDSDGRKKMNIATIDQALDKVQNLRGVNFEWKETEHHEEGLQMGFIAQEVEAVIPEVVSSGGNSYSMQYSPLTALLVEATKEQQILIESQNQIIDDLKARVQSLENQQQLAEVR